MGIETTNDSAEDPAKLKAKDGAETSVQDAARDTALQPGDKDALAAVKAKGSNDEAGDPADKALPAVTVEDGKPEPKGDEAEAAALAKLKGSVEKGELKDPVETEGIKDAASFKTGTEVLPAKEGEDPKEGEAPSEGDKPKESDSTPEVMAEMEKVKAQLDALFTNSDPQKQLLAVDGLASEGVTSFQLQDNGKNHTFTLQKSEIPGNRGVSNPKYASMDHLYVDGKVALRGNLLTNPGDGPSFDQQKHYKTGQTVDFAGSKGGPVMDGIKGELDGAKVLIEKNGIKMEATAVKAADGTVSFEMKEIKPPPKEVSPEDRIKDFSEHPEKFLPQLSSGDDGSRLGVMKMLSDSDIQGVEVTTKDGKSYNINSTFHEGVDGKPPYMVLNLNGKTALVAEPTDRGTKITPDAATMAELKGIDWAGADVKIDYANPKVEDRQFKMPEQLEANTVVKQLDSKQITDMITARLPEGDLEKTTETKDNVGALKAFLETSTGYKAPESKNIPEMVYGMVQDNAVKPVELGQDGRLKAESLRAGDIILAKEPAKAGEGQEGYQGNVVAGIYRGDGQIVVPTDDGSTFKSLGTLGELNEGGFQTQALRPESFKVETVETPEPEAKERPDDIASILKDPSLGVSKSFEWMDKDSSMADIEKGILAHGDLFEGVEVEAAKLDRKDLKSGDVIATGKPGESKVAVFLRDEKHPDGLFVTDTGDKANPFNFAESLDKIGLQPSEGDKYRVYRAKQLDSAKEAEEAPPVKTEQGERGNFDTMSVDDARRVMNDAFDKFMQANNANGDITSLQTANQVLKETTRDPELPEFKSVEELENSLSQRGFVKVEPAQAKVGDLVILKPKVEGQVQAEVGLASEDGQIKFGKFSESAENLAKNFDISFYSPDKVQRFKDTTAAEGDQDAGDKAPEKAEAVTWSDRAKALGSADYVGEGKPNPWSDMAINPFERGLTKEQIEPSLTSHAISRELGAASAGNLAGPIDSVEALRARLFSQNSGFEADPKLNASQPDSVKAGDIIYGIDNSSGKNNRFIGVVGEDGKVYSAKVVGDKQIEWSGQDLKSFEGYRTLERYRQKGATEALPPITGPADEAAAKESASVTAEMFTPLFDPKGEAMPNIASLDALKSMGVQSVEVTHPSQPGVKHLMEISETDGKLQLNIDGQKFMEGDYLNGQTANSYRFQNLAGMTFEVKFINGQKAVFVVPDDSSDRKDKR